jgi:hypothetical protein
MPLRRYLTAVAFSLLIFSPAMAIMPAAVSDTVIQESQVKAETKVNTGREGKMSALAVVGFALSILLPPIGILVSALALHQARKNHQRGVSLAKAGIIVGAAMIGAFFIFSFIYLIVRLSSHPM